MNLTIRDAVADDLAALAAVRYADRPAIHRDRIRDAAGGEHIRYLLAEADGKVVGYGVLVLVRPPSWPDDHSRLPRVVDLRVCDAMQGRGIGAAMVRRMEEIAAERGCEAMHLGADSVGNPDSVRFYERLGYTRQQDEPERRSWRFTDSDGRQHAGENWEIDMRKPLQPPAGED